MGRAGKDGRLVLASGSPRRREILESAGLEFEVEAPNVFESPPSAGEDAEDYAQRMACHKALAVSARLGRGVVLGADTVVVLEGEILGKPESASQAEEMLDRLRGRGHEVATGLAAVDSLTGRVETAAVTSTVHMREYDDDEVAAYVASGEPFDKAGAYGVQDPDFRPAEGVEGCYLNVVGLPFCRAAALLSSLGLSWAQGQVSGPGDRCTACKPPVWDGEGGR